MMEATLAERLSDWGLLDEAERFVADLHVHSVLSDGSDSAEEIMRAAANQGLTHVALTNHDTTRGLDEARAAGEASGVRVIGGIEVSAYDFIRGRKVHVLGLGLNEGSRTVESVCAETLRLRERNSRWQLDRLIETGFAPDIERIEALAAQSTCLYKQHIMAGLTDALYGTPEYTALYRGLFKNGGICARDIAYLDARVAVQAILEDGGVPVLAHPGQLASWDFIPELVSCGLAGIEAFHHDHNRRDEERALACAHEYGLLITGGSDYHGRFGGVPSVGFRRVEG